MTSRRSESECTHTLTDEAAAKLRAIAEETSKKTKKKKSIIRSSSVKSLFGGKEEGAASSKEKKPPKKAKEESSRKTRKSKRSNSISSPYAKRRERSWAKSETADEDEEEDEEEACELTPYLDVNARGFRKEKMMFAVQIREIRDLSDDSVGKRFSLSWRRGVKKENSGKTAKSFCSVTGVIQLNKLVNCMCTMKSSYDNSQYQEKSMAFVLRKEGRNKLQVVGSAVINLAKFASEQHKTHTTTVTLSKAGSGAPVANLILEVAALQAGGDASSQDSRKKRPLKKRRSLIISSNEALDKLMEEEAKRAEESGRFTDAMVFSDASSVAGYSDSGLSGDELEPLEEPFTGFDMVIETSSGSKRSRRRSLILPLRKEDVVEEKALKEVEEEVKKQRMKLIPLEVVGIPTEEEALEAEEQRRQRKEAEEALRKAEADERARKEHELYVAMKRYEIQQMKAEEALVRYDTAQRQKLLDTIERLKGIIDKLTRERKEADMEAKQAIEENNRKLELVTTQLETIKEKECAASKQVGELEMELSRGVALRGALTEERERAAQDLETRAKKFEIERQELESQIAELRSAAHERETAHKQEVAALASALAVAEGQLKDRESELDSMKRQKEALEEELTSAKALLEETQQEKKQVTETLYAKESDLSSTVAALKGAQAEVLALQSSTSDVGMELARAKASLAKSEEELLVSGRVAVASQHDLKLAEEELSKAQEEIDGLSARRRELIASLDDANARVTRLEQELAAALASCAAAVATSESSQQEMEDMASQLESVRQSLEKAEKAVAEREEELVEASTRADTALEELKQERIRLAELEQALKQSEARIAEERETAETAEKELTSQLEARHSTLEGTTAELLASKAAYEELHGQYAQWTEQKEAQVGELQRHQATLEESLTSAKVEVGDWKAQYEAQVAHVAAVTATVDAVTAEKQEISQSLEAAKKQIEILEEKEKSVAIALEKAVEDHIEEKKQYLAQIADQERLCGKLNVSIEQLRVTLEDVQSQREMAEIAQRDLEQEKATAAAEMDDLRVALDAATERVETLTEELRAKAELCLAIPKLENEITDMRTREQELVTATAALRNEVSEKEKQVTELTSALEATLSEKDRSLEDSANALSKAESRSREELEQLKESQEKEVSDLKDRLDVFSSELEDCRARLATAAAASLAAEELTKERELCFEKDTTALKNELQSVMEERDVLQQKLSDAADELASTKRSLSAVEESLQSMEAAHADSTRSFDDVRESLSAQMAEQRIEHDSALAQLRSTVESQEHRMKELMKERDSLDAQVKEVKATAEREISEATKALDGISEEKDSIVSELKDIEQKYNHTRTLLSTAETELAQAKSMILTLETTTSESVRGITEEREATESQLRAEMSDMQERIRQLETKLEMQEKEMLQSVGELKQQLQSANEVVSAKDSELETLKETLRRTEEELQTHQKALTEQGELRSNEHSREIELLRAEHAKEIAGLEDRVSSLSCKLEEEESAMAEAEQRRSALSLQLQEATVVIEQLKEEKEKEKTELVSRLSAVKDKVEEQLPAPCETRDRAFDGGEDEVKFYFGDLLSELEIDTNDLITYTTTLQDDVETTREERKLGEERIQALETEKQTLEEKLLVVSREHETVEAEQRTRIAELSDELQRRSAEAEEKERLTDEERARNELYAQRMAELKASLSMTEFQLDGMERSHSLLSEEALLQQLDNVAMHVVVENIYSAPVGESVSNMKSTAAHDAADIVFRSLTAVPSLAWAKRQLSRIHDAIKSCALLSRRNLSALIYWLSFASSLLDMLQALEEPDLGFAGKVFNDGVLSMEEIGGNQEEQQWQTLVYDIYALVMEHLYDQLNVKARAGLMKEPIVPPPRGRFTVARPITRSDVISLFRDLLASIHSVRLFMSLARQVIVPTYYATNALIFHELLGKPELCNGEIGLQIKASLSYLQSVSGEFQDSDYRHIVDEGEGHFDYATAAANFLITISNEIAFPTVKAVQETFPRFNLAQIKHFIDMYCNSGYSVKIPPRVQEDIEDACAAAKALGEMPLYLQPQLSLHDLKSCNGSSADRDWMAK